MVQKPYRPSVKPAMPKKVNKELSKITKQKEQLNQTNDYEQVMQGSNKEIDVASKLDQIDLGDLEALDTFGGDVEQRSTSLDAELSNITVAKAGTAVDGLSELLTVIKDNEPNAMFKKVRGWHILQKPIKFVTKMQERVESVESQLHKLEVMVDNQIADRQNSVNNINKMLQYNQDTGRQLTDYINGTQSYVNRLSKEELPLLKEALDNTMQGSVEYEDASSAYVEMLTAIDHLNGRIVDLNTHRQTLLMNASQLRSIQNTNAKVIRQARKVKTSALPIFKVNARTMIEAMQAEKDMDVLDNVIDYANRSIDATNEKVNAVNLKVAKLGAQPGIDENKYAKLIEDTNRTNQEILAIDAAGREARKASAERLAQLSHDDYIKKIDKIREINAEVIDG